MKFRCNFRRKPIEKESERESALLAPSLSISLCIHMAVAMAAAWTFQNELTPTCCHDIVYRTNDFRRSHCITLWPSFFLFLPLSLFLVHLNLIVVVFFGFLSDGISYATQIKKILLQLCGSSIGYKPTVKDLFKIPCDTQTCIYIHSLASSRLLVRWFETLKRCAEYHIWRKMGRTYFE